MVYEKINLKFDVEKLRVQLVSTVMPLPPHMHAMGYHGGWGVTTLTGHYKEGWEQTEFFTAISGVPTFDLKKAKEKNYQSVELSKVPSEICKDYLYYIISSIESLGFSPRRARISLLKAGVRTRIHQDHPSHIYSVRMHIPIITNGGCFFVSENEKAHMPADGSVYLVAVNKPHYVYNEGSTDRYHLMMDVWDTKNISQHHQYGYPEVHWNDYE